MGVILEYLNQRKEKEKEEEKKEKFSLENWIPDAAKKAKQLSLATHVCKFSHPDAQATPIISKQSFRNDGYLHSGNVEYTSEEYGIDAFGNAAAMGVFKFLLLKMKDGRTILEHLEQDSEDIREELSFFEEQYPELRQAFLEIKKCNEEPASDERVKQVYFPLSDGQYHLLSLLTPTVIVRELRSRIIEMRRKRIAAKDKNNEEYGQNWAEIYNLTEIGFGGTKPQNISAVNMSNGGKAYLLLSSPPSIANREVIRPKKDFFTNSLRRNQFKQDFQYLHTLLDCDHNNLIMRNKVKLAIQNIVEQVMVSVYRVRETEKGWSERPEYEQLPMAQKNWLDDIHAIVRQKDKEWLGVISFEFARWIMKTYEQILKDDRITLGDGELLFLQKQVAEVLKEEKEGLQ